MSSGEAGSRRGSRGSGVAPRAPPTPSCPPDARPRKLRLQGCEPPPRISPTYSAEATISSSRRSSRTSFCSLRLCALQVHAVVFAQPSALLRRAPAELHAPPNPPITRTRLLHRSAARQPPTSTARRRIPLLCTRRPKDAHAAPRARSQHSIIAPRRRVRSRAAAEVCGAKIHVARPAIP